MPVSALRLQDVMASYLRDIARWRRMRADEFDRDPRNLSSAAGLDEFAAYVQTLPDDDPRVQELTRWLTPSETFEPEQRVHVAISRFHFFGQDATNDGFLTHLDELSRADRNEHGRFGGVLPEGDDPWAQRWDPSVRKPPAG